MQRRQITVAGDSDASTEACAAAEAVGRLVAEAGAIVVTGGRGGVMEAACRGAIECGGIAVGILPGDDRSAASPWCTVVVPTGIGHARNAINALAGDAMVVIGSSAGTISEACFAWIHRRALFVHALHSPWIRGFAEHGLDARSSAQLVVCGDDAELLLQLRGWLATGA